MDVFLVSPASLLLLPDIPFPNLGALAYPLISLLVAIEGPVAILLFSAAASAGLLDPIFVFLAASAGNLLADLVWYSIGYFSKMEWIERHIKWFRDRQETIEGIKSRLHTNAAKLLFLAKITSGLVIPSLIIAGLIRVPLRKWFPSVLLGETIVTGALVLLGYFASTQILKIQTGMQYVFLGLTLIFIVGVLYFGQKALRKIAE
jgi:membrane protein DedA with SNARE-associated domain